MEGDSRSPLIGPCGEVIDIVADYEKRLTALVGFEKGTVKHYDGPLESIGRIIVPIPFDNRLVVGRVVLFPSETRSYENEASLHNDIVTFVQRYFECEQREVQLLASYVTFTWVYDAFNELPYLRLIGDYGTGKSRLIKILGSICYRGTSTSGASSVASLYHVLDMLGGTLIVDEADFRFSDEKSEIAKILNIGNMRGMSLLRMEKTPKQTFVPRVINVFGPKIIAARGHYQDRALESRFLTLYLKPRKLAKRVPINLPDGFDDEALELRNKLLMFRLKNLRSTMIDGALVDWDVEPRLNQVFVPLMSSIKDPDLQELLWDIRREYHQEHIAFRGNMIEANVLRAIQALSERDPHKMIAVGEIAKCLSSDKRTGGTFSARWVGNLVRTKLHLRTQKSNGVFVIPYDELSRLGPLFERYGVDKLTVEEE